MTKSIQSSDKVRIDNSWYLALQTYHRHQLPTPDLYGWNQFRRPDDTPIYPQRDILIGPIGAMNVSYTFKVDGDKLTGTTTSPDGKEIAIKDGKIDGNNISFSISLDMGGQEMKIDLKGVLSGDELKLSTDMMGQSMEIPLKRAK